MKRISASLFMSMLAAFMFTNPAGAEKLPGAPAQVSSMDMPPMAMMQIMHENLISPVEIIRYRQKLDLSAEQAKHIKKSIMETESRLAGLNWELQDTVQELDTELSTASINEDNALKKLNKIFELENRIKKTRFLLLVRIKNELTPKQLHEIQAIKNSKTAPPPLFGYAKSLPENNKKELGLVSGEPGKSK